MSKNNFTKHAPTQAQTNQAAALLGSSVLPALILLNEGNDTPLEIQLGALVAEAHADSGLTTAEWNELEEGVRESHLNVKLEALKAEAVANATKEADLLKAANDAADLGETDPAEALTYVAVFGGPIHHPTNGTIFTGTPVKADEDQWLVTQIEGGKIKLAEILEEAE